MVNNMNETEEMKETAEVTEDITTETEVTETDTAIQTADEAPEERKDEKSKEKAPYTFKTFINDVCDIELFGLGSINTYGINKDNCFVSEAGDYKLGGVQKLNGTIGLGFWF